LTALCPPQHSFHYATRNESVIQAQRFLSSPCACDSLSTSATCTVTILASFTTNVFHVVSPALSGVTFVRNLMSSLQITDLRIFSAHAFLLSSPLSPGGTRKAGQGKSFRSSLIQPTGKQSIYCSPSLHGPRYVITCISPLDLTF
jgi:hypothetical protein